MKDVFSLSSDELQNLLELPKQAFNWTGWQARENHAGHLHGVATLVDPKGITMPGLTVQLEIKAPVVALTCFYLFSLMQASGRERKPIYQLEVTPRGKRSHNGKVPIYGPHEHLGQADPLAVTEASVDCDSWAGCLQWFFSRVNLTPFQIPDPMVN